MSLLTKHSLRRGTLKKTKSKSLDVEYTDHDLPSLRRKRTIAYKRLSKALEIGLSATENASDLTQRELFLSYHQEIKQIAASFEHTHFAILDISDDPEQNDDEIQDRFDEMYFKVLAIHRNFTTGESSQSAINKHTSNIRLPKITLPSFSGNVKKWPEFIDAFNALIHNSTSLTETEKFHYLISSLSGDALLVIKTFPITHEHYQDAYQALTTRYKSKRELAFTCWRDLLNMEFNSCDAHEFRKSLDAFEENLSILKTVNLPVGQWDFVLVYHILSKLDKTLRRDFEEKYYNTELPSYNQLKEYLHSKCEALVRDSHFTESTPLKCSKLATSKVIPTSLQQKRTNVSHALIVKKEKPQNSINSRSIINQPPSSTCTFCGGPHFISSCADFLKKSHEERMQLAAEKNWCFNCLKSSHQLKDCTSIFTCRKCRRKHHTLLHRDNPIESNNTASSLVARSLSGLTVLLPTAVVHVKDASGRMQTFRALFDTGSQSNFITESAVNRLNLIRSRTDTRISGLGEAGAQITGNVTCDIGTHDKKIFTLNLHVISKICGDQPIAQSNTSGWSHIESLPLADPGFHIPGPIDILFAADVFVESLLHQTIKGMPNQPSAINSVFGWLLLGSTCSTSSTLSCSSLDADIKLNPLVERVRELNPSPAHTNLPHQYSDFGSNHIETSHISLVPTSEIDKRRERPESRTIPLRVILNGTAKDVLVRSIHDVQLSRSKLPPNISAILHNSLWWAGPCWLSQEREPWPIFTENPAANERVSNCPNPAHAIRSEHPTNRERRNSHSLMQIEKHLQQRVFDEIKQIQSEQTSSRLFRKSNLFLNDRRVLKVGGKISRSGLEYEHEHPVFLPSDHPPKFLILDFFHHNCCHPGINTTYFLMLQQFWINSVKRTIRNHLAKWSRTHPQPLQPFMSDHPQQRVNQVKPFSVVGVRFGGLFRIKLRGPKIGGARNVLSALVRQASSSERTDFIVNLPSAPHFGELWGIRIKTARSHRLRIVGQVLRDEELTTLFVQIQATLNSRPLCAVSSDPNDLSVLTSGHVLTLEPLTAAPDEDFATATINRLRRWQLLHVFHQNFWSSGERSTDGLVTSTVFVGGTNGRFAVSQTTS